MLEQVCSHIHNWFEVDAATGKSHILCGRWQLTATAFVDPPVGIIAGQHFRIRGSVLNDGVYVYSPFGILNETGMFPAQFQPETFDGEVWLMRVPKAFMQLVTDIQDYQTKYADVLTSPYQSESFGGYSYTKATGAGDSSATANGADWRSVFAARLNPWRKLC